ncbi:hypothetical protein [Planococcus sp. YIM B11945]
MDKHPKINVPKSNFERAFDAEVLLLFSVMLVYLFSQYGALPDCFFFR